MPKRAVDTFARTDPKTGLAIVVNPEDVYADDHPLVKLWPDMFEDFMLAIVVNEAPARATTVEQATAAPGELRQTGRSPMQFLEASIPPAHQASAPRRKPGRPRKAT